MLHGISVCAYMDKNFCHQKWATKKNMLRNTGGTEISQVT